MGCTICGGKLVGRGLCRSHYQSMWKQGKLELFSLCKDPLKVRLMAKIRISESGCWEWTGQVRRDGYGLIWKDGKAVRAHREMYRLSHPEMLDDAVICHKCDNRGCVNPDHLFAGTRDDNNKDAMKKGRTASGPRSGLSKLTTEQARAIKEDPRSQTTIAKEYGICQSHVSRIKSGELRAKG